MTIVRSVTFTHFVASAEKVIIEGQGGIIGTPNLIIAFLFSVSQYREPHTIR